MGTDWEPRLLEALRRTGSVRLAAREAGVAPDAVARQERRRPALRRAVAEAIAEAVDALEAEARRRAVEGVARPVYYAGQECGEVRHYSDALLLALLRACRPERFGRPAGGGPAQERGLLPAMPTLRVRPVEAGEEQDADGG